MKIFITLLYSLLVCNVYLKLFTNKLNLLPRLFNIVDVMIVAILLLFFLSRLHNIKNIRFKGIFVALLLFNLIMILGSALNIEYIYFQATAAQIVMFNEPLILFLVLVNLPFSMADIHKFIKIFYILILSQCVIGIFQIPFYFSTGDSESIIGTFHHNPEQYSLFMLIGVFYVIGKTWLTKTSHLKYYLLILTMLTLNILVDNKASWPFIALSLIFIYILFSYLNNRLSAAVKYLFTGATAITFGLFVILNYSNSLHKYEKLFSAAKEDNNNLFEIRKINAYEDILKAFNDYPHMSLIGSGPGTFYSRSSYQFYPDHSTVKKSRKRGEYKKSDSMAGVINHTSQEPFFRKYDQNRKYFFFGSGQTDIPFSSLAALLGETGFLGMITYLGIYIVILYRLIYSLKKYKRNKAIFPLILCSSGTLMYFILGSSYFFWIETGRMSTILWSMIAISFKYNEIVQLRKNEIARVIRNHSPLQHNV